MLTAEGVVLGVVRSYSAGPPRVAGVRLMGGLETLLASVPVAAHVPAADLTAGRECVVAFLEPNDLSSAVLVGVVGATVGSGMAEHANEWHTPDMALQTDFADHNARHEPGGADPMAVDAAAGTGSLRTLGAGATAACAGSDGRLSDARTPTAHKATHEDGGADKVATDIFQTLRSPAAERWAIPGWSWGAVTSSTLTTGHLVWTPIYVGKAMTYIRISTYVSSAATAGSARLGIYGMGADYWPDALLLDAGTVDVSVMGLKEVVISLALAPGWYWTAFVADYTGMLQVSMMTAAATGSMWGPMAAKTASSGTATDRNLYKSGCGAYVAGGLPGSAPDPEASTGAYAGLVRLRET